MRFLKKAVYVAVLVVSGLSIAAPAFADYELEAARGPDGQVVVYCEWCWFIACDCHQQQT